MEGLPRTHESDIMQFVVFAIEGGAKLMGISPTEFANRLQKQDLIEKRLIAHYDMLHTQSKEYVAEDIVETLKNWEAEQ